MKETVNKKSNQSNDDSIIYFLRIHIRSDAIFIFDNHQLLYYIDQLSNCIYKSSSIKNSKTLNILIRIKDTYESVFNHSTKKKNQF